MIQMSLYTGIAADDLPVEIRPFAADGGLHTIVDTSNFCGHAGAWTFGSCLALYALKPSL
jgi:hypothetical protein